MRLDALLCFLLAALFSPSCASDDTDASETGDEGFSGRPVELERDDAPITGQSGTFGVALLWGGFEPAEGSPPTAPLTHNHVRAMISSAGRIAPVRLIGQGTSDLHVGSAGAALRFSAENDGQPAGFVLNTTLGDADALVLEEGGWKTVIRPAHLMQQLGSTEVLPDGRTLSMVAFEHGTRSGCSAGVAWGSWSSDALSAHRSEGVVVDDQGALVGRFVGKSEDVSSVTWLWARLTEREGQGALSASVHEGRLQGSIQRSGTAPGSLLGLVNDTVSSSGLLVAAFRDACEVSE